ncbi:Spy/CpxP family protein refolding chaperone [Elioraea sp.]
MSDEGVRRRMMMIHHRAADGPPMNVIINIGPGIRVEAEEGDDGRGGRQGRGMVPPGGAGMMGPGMMGMMMGPRGGAMGPDALRHFERIEAHLAYVRAALRVTDAQMPQWDAFAEAARAAAGELRQAYAQAVQAAAQPASAPTQLERRAALLSAQLEATRAVAAAAAPLYAALSDEQRRTADELLAEHLRGMRMRGL